MLHHEAHRIPVTALALSEQYLLAGEGPFLRISRHDTSETVLKQRIFDAQAVHGIVLHGNLVIVWGGSLVSTFLLSHLHRDEDAVCLEPGASLQAVDWILDLCLCLKSTSIGHRTAIIVTAHNALLSLSVDESGKSETGIVELTSNSKCILYSAHVFWLREDHILVASGTVFGEIIVWSCLLQDLEPSKSVLHQILRGHEGSIFGVQIFEPARTEMENAPSRLLASCSDDRTIRIWDLSTLEDASGDPQAAADILSSTETGFGANIDAMTATSSANVCIARAWGHGSRIWSVRLVASTTPQSLAHLVSFGEDATCHYWNLVKNSASSGCDESGPFSLALQDITGLHSGKNIWSSTVQLQRPDSVTVATGGADGSIALQQRDVPFLSDTTTFKTWSVDEIISQCPAESRAKKQDKLRSYAFINTEDLLVTTDNGHVLLLNSLPSTSLESSERQQWEWICQNDSLRGYSIVSAIAKLSIGFLAGADGSILLYDSGNIEELMRCDGKVITLLAKDFTSAPRGEVTVGLLIATVAARTALLLHVRVSGSEDKDRNVAIVAKKSLELPSGFVVTSFDSEPIERGTHLRSIFLGSRNGSIAHYCLETDLEETTDSSVPSTNLVDNVHGKDTVTDLSCISKVMAGQQRTFLFSIGKDGTLVIHRVIRSGRSHVFEMINETMFQIGTSLEGLSLGSGDTSLTVWGFRSKRFFTFDVVNDTELLEIDCGGSNRMWRFEPSFEAFGGTLAWTKASHLSLACRSGRTHKAINSGGHGREIKALAPRPTPSASKLDGVIFATGSEDTNIKLFLYQKATQKFQCLRTLRKHNTGIQQLEWSPDGLYLFSSGGFEEFCVWKVQEAPLIKIGVVCESVCPVDSDMPDLRIMGFAVAPISAENKVDDAHEFRIAMVRSDSTIRIYHYTSSPTEALWQLLSAGNYLTSCLTQCLQISDRGSSVMMTAGTDGHIAFWPTMDSVAQDQLDRNTTDPAVLQWTQRHRIHQNTIHCVRLHWLTEHDCLLISGGDDNALGITRCTWRTTHDLNIESPIMPRAHAAAITGLEIICTPSPPELTLASVGIDQRVRTWQIRVDATKPGIEGVEIERLQNVFTSVADSSSIAVLELCGKARATVVCGVGMEVWRHDELD